MEAWDSEPFDVDSFDLYEIDDDMRMAVKNKTDLGQWDLQYMTFRVLYDIRNALLMIHDELRDLRKGNNQ